MHLTRNKLEVIVDALKLVLDVDGDNDAKRQRRLEALHWAQEQQRRRANGERSYLNANLKRAK